MAKKKTEKVSDSIKDAIKYPWTKMKRAFWFWLILIPVFGWLPLYGYILDVIESIAKGKDKELPRFGKYWPSFVQGFYYLVFSAIVAVVVGVVLKIPFIGWVAYVYVVMITPMLMVNYSLKRNFGAFFDIGKATKLVFENLLDYILLILKAIAVMLFWLLCSIPIITLVWTLPAMQWSEQYLIAQFFRKHN